MGNFALAFLTVLVGMWTISPVFAYNILYVQAYGSTSHKIAFDPIAIELGRRGHHVTLLSIVKTIPDSVNVTNIVLEGVKKYWHSINFTFFEQGSGTVKIVLNLYESLRELTRATFREPEVADIMRHPRTIDGTPKYDLVIVDGILNEFALPLAQRMEVPSVFFSPSAIFPLVAWDLNIPYPAYVPYLGLDFVANTPFVNRLKSTVMHICLLTFLKWYALPMLDNVVRESYPQARSIEQLMNNVSMVIANSHFSYAHSVPSMPYYHEFGGLNLVSAKKLPKEFEEVMQKSGDHGVIYFSLGSFTRGDAIPSGMRDKLIQAFAQLDQTIIWKYEKQMDNLSSNVFLTKWAPQQDILGHPKLRMFITHGGGMSTQEAIFNGVPVLGFPLSADQPGNIALAVSRGFGEALDWRTFTLEELLWKIKLLLHDKSYKESAMKYSRLLRDRPGDPVEGAVYWLEYVVRHQGAPHLKSGAEQLNLLQYLQFDVWTVLGLLLFAVICVVSYILRKVFALLRTLFSGILNRNSDASYRYKLKSS